MSDGSDDDEYYDSDDVGGIEDFEDDEEHAVLATKADKGKAIDLNVKHESYSPERLHAEIDREIEEIVSVLGVDRGLALIFLLHYRWNRDKLIETYTDSPSRVLDAVGEPQESAVSQTETESKSDRGQSPSINPPSPAPNGPSKSLLKNAWNSMKGAPTPPRKRPRRAIVPPPPEPEPENVCGVCFDEIPTPSDGNGDTTSVPNTRCNHRFCRDCWEAYLLSKIKDEGQCSIRCMADKCKTALDENFIKTIVSSDVYERWRALVSQSYVSAMPSYRFCPAPSCAETIHCTAARIGSSALLTVVPTVTCSQGHPLCFGCGIPNGHAPVICSIASQWLESKEDAGTTQWINANTRKCPKCNNSIEKAGGCNRMLCRHCKYQFCWMCMKNWDVHGYNDSVCNAFVEPPRTSSMNDAQANLERWLFYFDRFNNHELSTRLDQELVERTQEKMIEIQESSDLSWIETHFMQNAVDELTKCRQTLKWTYAMAHFLIAGNKKQMFEDIQADLEKAVELLSQLIEEPIEEESIKDLRQKVMDKTIYVQKRHEVMLIDAAKGLADGTWEWTVNID